MARHHESRTPARKEEEEEEDKKMKLNEVLSHVHSPSLTSTSTNNSYQRTPLPTSMAASSTSPSLSSSHGHRLSGADRNEDSVSCYTCRPKSARADKVTAVGPGEDHHGGGGKVPGVFKSLLLSIARKSPRWTGCDFSPANSLYDESYWSSVVAELSQKLVAANRRRDEAVAEASRLRSSMGELERKLGKLEGYCHELKHQLDTRISVAGVINPVPAVSLVGHVRDQIQSSSPRSFDQTRAVDLFLQSVSDARKAVRGLAKAISCQLFEMGAKSLDRILALLNYPSSDEVRIPAGRNYSRALVIHLEALLSRCLYEDFETPDFHRSGVNAVLGPAERCSMNLVAYSDLKGLTWEEVLGKGTRHFSEGFSRYCDLKMSSVVVALGWNKAWPEPLLRAFFLAAKHVWLVHLIAFFFHPGLPIFRVERGVQFSGTYMEEISSCKDSTEKGSPAIVRVMVSPGFYVFNSVIKCKVLCKCESGSSC